MEISNAREILRTITSTKQQQKKMNEILYIVLIFIFLHESVLVNMIRMKAEGRIRWLPSSASSIFFCDDCHLLFSLCWDQRRWCKRANQPLPPKIIIIISIYICKLRGARLPHWQSRIAGGTSFSPMASISVYPPSFYFFLFFFFTLIDQ